MPLPPTDAADTPPGTDFRRRAFLKGLAATALVVAAGGCGGGGGGSSTMTEVLPEACSDSAYVPNYATGDGTGMNFARWRGFPITVYFDPTASAYTTDLQTRGITALNGWVTQTGSQVTYTVVTSAANADVVIHFVPTTDTVLTSVSAVGLTYADADNSAVVYNRPYLVGATTYVGIDGDVRRENGTIAHEFGHALGIGGHSPVYTDLMYRSGSTVRSLIPTVDDVNTLRTCYCDDFPQVSAESRVVVPASRRVRLWGIE